MKILVVCQYYYPEPFRITDICETLVQHGHNVTVLTGLPNYPEGRVVYNYRWGRKRKEIINGVKIVRVFEIGRGASSITLFLSYISYMVSGSIKALLNKEIYDVIFVNQLSPILMGIPAVIYKKKHHKKLLLYCLDLWPASLFAGNIKENSPTYKLFFSISKWIYSKADKILITSKMFEDYFRKILSITTDDIEYLPQYAEDLFENNMEISTKTEIEKNYYNFVFAGNIGDMQSVETIIKAANELRDSNNIKFHIIGDGSKLYSCKRLATDLKLTNVMFYGRRPVEEMPQFYKMADAMIITLKNNEVISYTLPGKVQSYMAAAKPIIGSVNGETQRIINESECGLCCNAEDYMELANIIMSYCKTDKKEEMSVRSQKYYCDNFKKEQFMCRLEEILSNLGG